MVPYSLLLGRSKRFLYCSGDSRPWEDLDKLLPMGFLAKTEMIFDHGVLVVRVRLQPPVKSDTKNDSSASFRQFFACLGMMI